MNTPTFRSSLASAMGRFVKMERSVGKLFDTQAKLLMYFDRFLCRRHPPGPYLSREILDEYLASLSRLTDRSRANQMNVVRAFCRYLAMFDSRCYIPDGLHVANTSFSRVPFVYTRAQVCALVAKAGELTERRWELRPFIYRTLFGLLYATGIRVGEALDLNMEDVDLSAQRLHIQMGKFGKSRWVPLSSSTSTALAAYIARRLRACPADPIAPVFINRKGRRLPYRTVCGVFKRLLMACGIRKDSGAYPRVHDLRHTFACHRLLEWYRAGENVQAKLPALTTYMGHVDLQSTHRYLHATPDLLAEANTRFLAHYRHTIKKGQTHE